MSASESEADTVLNDSAGGVIQKREWRRAQKGASQSHSLPLSLGQVRTIISKQMIQASTMGCLLNVLPTGIGPSQSDIVCQRETEYIGVLAHQSLLGTQVCSTNHLDRQAGNLQIPTAHLSEPQNRIRSQSDWTCRLGCSPTTRQAAQHPRCRPGTRR